MSKWVDVDLEGLRKNSSLAKVIGELAQNALDTRADKIFIDIKPDGRGLGRVTVMDNDPDGYVRLSDAFTLFAPSTKAGDDTKRGVFNVGEKEFLSFCVHGRIETTTGTVIFPEDGPRELKPRKKREFGSLHDFTLRMTREDQADMVARLREIILDGSQLVDVNGEVLVARPALLESSITLPLIVADPDDPYRFVPRRRMTTITLHEPAAGGPTLHVIGMPVQPVDCPYSVNVHGRLKLDQARDQVAAPTVAVIMAEVANMLAAAEKLTEEDAQNWAGNTLGRHSTPAAVKAIFEGKFGPDAVVASPTHRGANADAASAGRPLVYGGSLGAEAWSAIKRTQAVVPDFAPVSTVEFGSVAGGLLDQPIDDSEWTADARRVVAWTHEVFALCFPNDGKLDIKITGGKAGKGCIAAAGRNHLTFNQGQVGWGWFKRENNVEIIDTVIHELAHHAEAGADHTSAWGHACCAIAGKLAVWGKLP